jgi:L-ascorbate metabolism protein UlaG (beta-lactamase superfamily)
MSTIPCCPTPLEGQLLNRTEGYNYPMVDIEWLGHSCFLVIGSRVRVVVDPFKSSPDLSYPPIRVTADLVLITHEHFDHNNASGVAGNPVVARGPGEWESPIPVKGLAASHGKGRGTTAVYVFRVDDLSFCHLGDLGEIPSAKLVKEIGSVDVLMIPVGGTYTIDHSGADQVLKLLNPKIVLPMHYKTEFVGLSLDPVSKFTRDKTNVRLESSNLISVDKSSLPKSTTIVVLAPPGPKV